MQLYFMNLKDDFNQCVCSWYNALSLFRGVFSRCLYLIILHNLDKNLRGQLSYITLHFSGLLKNREWRGKKKNREWL